jgi:hypothetical protein
MIYHFNQKKRKMKNVIKGVMLLLCLFSVIDTKAKNKIFEFQRDTIVTYEYATCIDLIESTGHGMFRVRYETIVSIPWRNEVSINPVKVTPWRNIGTGEKVEFEPYICPVTGDYVSKNIRYLISNWMMFREGEILPPILCEDCIEFAAFRKQLFGEIESIKKQNRNELN